MPCAHYHTLSAARAQLAKSIPKITDSQTTAGTNHHEKLSEMDSPDSVASHFHKERTSRKLRLGNGVYDADHVYCVRTVSTTDWPSNHNGKAVFIELP